MKTYAEVEEELERAWQLLCRRIDPESMPPGTVLDMALASGDAETRDLARQVRDLQNDLESWDAALDREEQRAQKSGLH